MIRGIVHALSYRKGAGVQIILPIYDFCIKELFANETVLKSFISDALEIPVEEIHSTRLLNPILRKRRKRQKLGVLDILVELNDDTKINIELQMKVSADWDKRQMFYISRLYTQDLQAGEDYGKLRRCVGISILDFNLTDREEYHSIYRLRDKDGNEFTDSIEIHTLELRKPLKGTDPLDEWIRFFNARSEEELDMILAKTQNAGIAEAIRELKSMSLGSRLRAHREERLKEIRDRKAQDKYVRLEGMKQGMEQGARAMTETCQEVGLSREEAVSRLVNKLGYKQEDAEGAVNRYWK